MSHFLFKLLCVDGFPLNRGKNKLQRQVISLPLRLHVNGHKWLKTASQTAACATVVWVAQTAECFLTCWVIWRVLCWSWKVLQSLQCAFNYFLIFFFAFVIFQKWFLPWSCDACLHVIKSIDRFRISHGDQVKSIKTGFYTRILQ